MTFALFLSGIFLAAQLSSIYGQSVIASVWPENQAELTLGQVSGVDVDAYGQVHVFHRGDHVWGAGAFDGSGQYLQKANGPIRAFTMLTLDPHQGQVLQRRGANRFYMPHGLTVDKDDNVWVTDVALHQVFKMGPQGDEPLMVLGQAFQRSKGKDGFCQPTDVAIGAGGEIFVSDGYCNSRVVKFSASGQFLAEFGERTSTWPPAAGQLRIPHDLTMLTNGEICVADRENQRIQCFDQNSGKPTKSSGNFGRVFALAANGDTVLGVSQPGLTGGRSALFAADSASLSPLNIESAGLLNPHDLALDRKRQVAYVGEIGPNRLIRIILQ